MTGTLVNEENKQMFLPVLGKDTIEDADVIVGVIDEETNTACGVLWAEIVDVGELDIRFIYVEESFRNKGAGKELIDTFLEISEDILATNISCSYINNSNNTYLYQLLDKAGFVDMSEELHEYAAMLKDFYVSQMNISIPDTKVLSVEQLERILQDKGEDAKKSLGQASLDRLSEMKIDSSVKNFSFVAVSEGEIAGGLIFGSFRNMLELKYLDAAGSKKDRILALLLQEAVDKAYDEMEPNTWILVNARSKEQREMLSYLTGGNAIRYYDYILFNLKL